MKPRHPSRAHAHADSSLPAAEGQGERREFHKRRPRPPRAEGQDRRFAEPEVMPEIPAAFAEMGLAEPLLLAVGALGFTEPTPVQLQSIAHALVRTGGEEADGSDAVGADLMVSSQTGSGKTAAFLLPVLHTILAAREGSPLPRMPHPARRGRFQPARPEALVLCPTRELAQQVSRDAIDLLRFARGVRVAAVTGGSAYGAQLAQLQNASVVVATPGRLLDLASNGSLELDGVRFLVVDEADRMLDLGFADDLEAINQHTANREQTMMFSATFAAPIQRLGMRVMRDGGAHVQRVEIHSAQESHANIDQQLFWADNLLHKRELLDHWLRNPEIEQAIVFASTQIECDELAQDLQDGGFNAAALHGAMNQGLRNRRLRGLRQGHIQILVATDVAARGIDVPTISHVFNFGLPMKAEDYTHRIGRTGRAGRQGQAVTFAEWRDMRKVRDIQHFTQQDIAEATIPGLEPKSKPAPKRKGPPKRGFAGNKGGGGRRDFGDRDGRPARRHDDNRFGGERFSAERAPRPRFGDERPNERRQDGRGFEGKRFDGERAAPRREDAGRFERRHDGRGAEGRGFEGRRFDDRRGDDRRFGDKRFDGERPGARRHGDDRGGFGAHKPKHGKPAAARRFNQD
jgi:superfamily II DNA/RNA helicase